MILIEKISYFLYQSLFFTVQPSSLSACLVLNGEPLIIFGLIFSSVETGMSVSSENLTFPSPSSPGAIAS